MTDEEQREMLAEIGINPHYQKSKLREMGPVAQGYAHLIKEGTFTSMVDDKMLSGILFCGAKAKDVAMTMAGALALTRTMEVKAMHLSTVSDMLDRLRFRDDEQSGGMDIYGTALVVHPFIDKDPVGKTPLANPLEPRMAFRIGAWLETRAATGVFTILISNVPWELQTWWKADVVKLIEGSYAVEVVE